MFKSKKQKAFTIIELIVVIAIIAILVLLAMLRFNGFTQRTKLTLIRNDIKAVETATSDYLLNNEKLPSNGSISAEELRQKANEGNLYNKRGKGLPMTK